MSTRGQQQQQQHNPHWSQLSSFKNIGQCWCKTGHFLLPPGGAMRKVRNYNHLKEVWSWLDHVRGRESHSKWDGEPLKSRQILPSDSSHARERYVSLLTTLDQHGVVMTCVWFEVDRTKPVGQVRSNARCEITLFWGLFFVGLSIFYKLTKFHVSSIS